MTTSDEKNKERIKRYREKLKQDPEKLKIAKEKQKIRNQNYYKKLKEEPEKIKLHYQKNKENLKNNPDSLEKRKCYLRQYTKNNKNKIKKYKCRAKEYQRNINLKKRYNITEETFQKLVEEQKSCCAICTEKIENLFIDHCHKTGKIRSLLCHKCNTAIGLLNEDINIMQNAIDYIFKHKK